MPTRQNSHVLVLRGRRGREIFERIAALKPESKEDIEKKKKEITERLERQGAL